LRKGIDEISCEHRHVDGKRDGEAISIQQLYAAFDRQYDQRRGSEIERYSFVTMSEGDPHHYKT